MRKSNLSIHSENILPIIKKWLYSSRDIFLRELVSNATDAIKKVRILRECGEDTTDTPFEIRVRLDKEKNTLTISDNGIGMTEAEVEKYIAQIAFSGAEEFLAKYKNQSEKDPIIGHFGLGFYSAYMVATHVEIQTLSSREGSQPVYWSCDGTSTYEIGPGTRQERGTDIILHLEKDSDYASDAKLQELLDRYCAFMPEPIWLNEVALKNERPLWEKAPSDCTDAEYLAFYRKMHPNEGDPYFWIHLNVDYPFRLKGILYFPMRLSRMETNESTIRLFCNRVYVADNCRDILPDYLMMLRGAIDSPDIPLNVSRSYLQVDQNVKQLGAHISKKVADRLSQIYKNERDKFIGSWPEIEPIVKFGLVNDEKFYERVKDAVIWKSSNGSWTTVTEYLDRAKEKKVYYTSKERSAAIQKAFLDKGLELLFTSQPYDPIVMGAFEKHLTSVTFHRIDSTLDDALIDPTREKTVLDENGKTVATLIADLFRSHLTLPSLEIEAKSLAADSLPGVVLLDEEMRRIRDHLILTQGKAPKQIFEKQTFVVNTNNKLVQATYKLSAKDPALAKDLIHQIYGLTRLSQKEIEPEETEELIAREQTLLERLATHLL